VKPVRRARISHQGVETGPPPPLCQAVTPEKWQQVVERAVADSLCDDPRTRDFGRRFLLRAPVPADYAAVTPPSQPIEGEMIDADEADRNAPGD
jgi:hypothetical protein